MLAIMIPYATCKMQPSKLEQQQPMQRKSHHSQQWYKKWLMIITTIAPQDSHAQGINMCEQRTPNHNKCLQ